MELTQNMGKHALLEKMRPMVMVEIDPKQCKPWFYHNRDKNWLTRVRCADLIKSIQRDGQLDPILVRKLEEDPDADYEIIYGARRAFACSQIPDQPVVAYITDVDDKTCMILMHAENANSQDISEFERAFSFAQQMKSGQFKNQTEMAEIMGLSQGTISKMIRAAEIFEVEWIRVMFPTKMDIPIKPAYTLSSLLKKQDNHERLKREALTIQQSMLQNGPLPATQVLRRLITAAKGKNNMSFESVILTSAHRPVICCRRDKSGRFSIIIEDEAKKLDALAVEAACVKAIREHILKTLFPGNNSSPTEKSENNNK